MTVGPVSGAVPAKSVTSASTAGALPAQSGFPPTTTKDVAALADAFAKAAKRNALPLANLHAAPPPMKAPMVAIEAAPLDRGQEQDALASLLTPAGGLGAPAQVAAPPPPTSFVDPSAFADLLTSLWLREQGRTAREVRVSFGDSAWPATGARLIRQEDGSLRVAVTLGDRGAGDHRSTEALKERLHARGLPVADISFEAD